MTAGDVPKCERCGSYIYPQVKHDCGTTAAWAKDGDAMSVRRAWVFKCDEPEQVCEWTDNNDYKSCKTACGKYYSTGWYHYGGLRTWCDFIFCPYCGRKVKVME